MVKFIRQWNILIATEYPDILNSPFLRLTSRKPLWLDLQPADIKSWWKHNWKSDQVINFLPSVRPHNPATGFWPPSATVVFTEPFSHEQGHCSASRKKWWLADTDLCPCSETQMMSHIVESCPLTKQSQSWMAAYPGCTLQMKMLFSENPGWPITVHDMHTRKRSATELGV